MSDAEFAQRVRAHFPDGLTGIIVIGGTRTSFVLTREAGGSSDPGRIDPYEYARYGVAAYTELIRTFFELGGQNLIVPGFSYQTFTAEPVRTPGGWRGEEFRGRYAPLARLLAGDEFVGFYRQMQVDPYFAGIDTILRLPPSDDGHALGVALRDFQAAWPYAPGRRRLVWEIASMPLYSYWQATAHLSAAERSALEAELAATGDLAQLHRRLYAFYSRAAFGTELPVPHFYLANNRNGDLKLRAPLAMSLAAGSGTLRCFYVPYPTLLVTRRTLRRLIEDLMAGGGLRSHDADYRGQFTPELLERERGRALALRENPDSILGLTRSL